MFPFLGTGKTFVMQAITEYVRSQKKICLVSAFSGVAAQLIEGGTDAKVN